VPEKVPLCRRVFAQVVRASLGYLRLFSEGVPAVYACAISFGQSIGLVCCVVILCQKSSGGHWSLVWVANRSAAIVIRYCDVSLVPFIAFGEKKEVVDSAYCDSDNTVLL
jgi:hypothetical protein